MDHTDFLKLLGKFNIRIELPLIEERQLIREIDWLIEDISNTEYDRGYEAGGDESSDYNECCPCHS